MQHAEWWAVGIHNRFQCEIKDIALEIQASKAEAGVRLHIQGIRELTWEKSS